MAATPPSTFATSTTLTPQQPQKKNTPPYKTAFLQSCLTANILTFGTYTLKSGRQSPYFFNAGLFHRADLLRTISTAYAHSILNFLSSSSSSSSTHPLDIDVLFGPAYKGIPLAVATVDKLAALAPERFGGLSYSFDRKEVKDHGEGGGIVGSSLKGKRVLIVDDVVTAGTAVGEAFGIIEREGGLVVGVVVALDRMERMSDGGKGEGEDGGGKRVSAIAEVERRYGVPVITIITLDDLIGHLKDGQSEENLRRLEEYKSRYGASG